jgi:hypothetical protein
MVRGLMPARVSGNRVSIRFAGSTSHRCLRRRNSPAAFLRALLRGPAIGQSDEGPSLIQARLLAGVRGWEQEAAFDPKTVRVVPASAVVRMLGPAAANRLLDRL